jgi:hypothetical protein
MKARITLAVSPGQYQFMFGYRGGVQEEQSLASNATQLGFSTSIVQFGVPLVSYFFFFLPWQYRGLAKALLSLPRLLQVPLFDMRTALAGRSGTLSQFTRSRDDQRLDRGAATA